MSTSRHALAMATLMGIGALSVVFAQGGPNWRTIQLVSQNDGRLGMVMLGADGAAYFRAQIVPNGCWGSKIALGGHDLRHLAAVSNADGRLEVFAAGGDGVAYHTWQTAVSRQWQDWQSLQGHDLRQVAAARNRDGRLEMFALGADGSAYHRWQLTAGGSWGEWRSLEGRDLRRIGAATNADGRLELFALGADGSLYHRWQASPGGDWVPWQTLLGRDLREVTATTNADGRLEVFALGGDGKVYGRRQASAGAGFDAWTSLEGSEVRQVAAGRNGDGRMEVIALGGDGEFYHRWQNSAAGKWLEWTAGTLCTDSAPPLGQIAAFWAPVVSQDIDAANVRADYLAAFDYDGDWSGSNNWGGIRLFDLRPVVYYWVLESPDRYFIGYGFYHPRDWTSGWVGDSLPPSDTQRVQHENDLEAVLLSVRKQRGFPNGRFEAMITIAHGPLFTFVDNDTPESSPWYQDLVLSRALREAGDDIDGDMDFVADDLGLHPVVYMQAEGHGAYGLAPNVGPNAVNQIDDYPPVFMQSAITDWRGANWTGVVFPPVSGDVSRTHATGSWGDGLIYHYETDPDNYARANTPSEALPRKFQVAGYALVPINGLWDRRRDFERAVPGARMFESYGHFVGGGADAPWNWAGNRGNLPAGVFFNDPARLFGFYLTNWRGGPSASCAYIANSLLAPPGACPD
jgi:hypothetical protein